MIHDQGFVDDCQVIVYCVTIQKTAKIIVIFIIIINIIIIIICSTYVRAPLDSLMISSTQNKDYAGLLKTVHLLHLRS